jgi:hypothetical protein
MMNIDDNCWNTEYKPIKENSLRKISVTLNGVSSKRNNSSLITNIKQEM